MKFDYVVVGAGIFGATTARLLTEAGASVLILEKEMHPGGHCFSYNQEGIEIHKYGPHIFHTANDTVWAFVNRFSEWYPFDLRVRVNSCGNYFTFPINLMTLTTIYGYLALSNNKEYILSEWKKDLVPNDNPQNFEEAALASVGKSLYEIFFKGYTTKQWGTDPKNLPKEIFSRLPVRLDLNDQYFSRHRNKYQGIPTKGYTSFIGNIIGKTPVEYGFDATLENLSKYKDSKVIYSGAPDSLLSFSLGRLPYRSLRFEIERHQGTYQGVPIVNYTAVNVPYTRITEHKCFTPIEHQHTFISKEYPASYEETNQPFYPIATDENKSLYNEYVKLLKEVSPNILLGGRLGTFQYLDMDQTVELAMNTVKELTRGT